jgi:hypothetical protein
LQLGQNHSAIFANLPPFRWPKTRSNDGGETLGRIKLTDTSLEMFTKMSEGNPGAVTVLCEMFKQTKDIDPQAFLGGIHYILILDDFEIYGSRIWKLYKDVCDQSIEGVITVLRGWQLGLISKAEILTSITISQPCDVAPLAAKVRAQVPTFWPMPPPGEWECPNDANHKLFGRAVIQEVPTINGETNPVLKAVILACAVCNVDAVPKPAPDPNAGGPDRGEKVEASGASK